MPLHLVRHAQALPDESIDPALSAEGVAQAETLAPRVRSEAVEVILHSPARRARQTADLLAARSDGPRVLQSDLVRDLTPWPVDDHTYSPRVRQRLESTPEHERDPGGRELDRALDALVAMSDQSCVCVVTHAFVVAWMAARIIGGPEDAWVRMPVDNATLTTIERSRHGDLLLRRFNSPT